MAWGVAKWAARGWDAHGWMRIGLRMCFRALLGYFGPRGGRFGAIFHIFRISNMFRNIFHIFPIIPGVAGLLFTRGRTAKKEHGSTASLDPWYGTQVQASSLWALACVP